ncbi:hypothetical protein GCM10010398_15660 [Streptomyces fimbriatus]
MPRSRTWTGCGAVLYASPAPDEGLTPVTGGEARLEDPRVTIAALLVAHGCGVGHTPVIGAADPLKYGRLSHVDQTCLRPATHRAAGATLIDYQASTPLARRGAAASSPSSVRRAAVDGGPVTAHAWPRSSS